MATYSTMVNLEFAKLTDRNFHEWQSRIRIALSTAGLWGTCTGEYTFDTFYHQRLFTVSPTHIEAHWKNNYFRSAQKREWDRMCDLATGAILSSMERYMFLRYEKYEDPELLWEALLDGHKESLYSSDEYLYSELDHTRLLEEESVASYISRVNHLLGQLQEEVPAAKSLSIMMAGLPNDWQVVKDSILAQPSPSIDMAIYQLEEFQIKEGDITTNLDKCFFPRVKILDEATVINGRKNSIELS
ncbi:hypothetical protein DFP73DRAFT_587089 [Morchella snyderi]|nr:hypothetical protein DFP73DRAFT_587089 [Morchella snyderi]